MFAISASMNHNTSLQDFHQDNGIQTEM